MYEAVNAITILIVVMVLIVVKLIQIDRTLKDQSESLARIAKHLEGIDEQKNNE